MKMKQFKEYMQERISSLSLEIETLEKRKEYLLSNPDISFDNYEGLGNVRRMYLADYNITGVRSLLPVPKSELKKYLVRKEINSIDVQITNIQRTIRQLSHAKYHSDENGFTSEIYPNDELIREIMLFCKGDDPLSYFRSLFIHVIHNDKIGNLERIIGQSIEEKGFILHNSIYETTDRIKKLFSEYVSMDGITNYLESLIIEIQGRYYNDSKEEVRLAKLKVTEYICNGKIIKTYSDLEEFGILLKRAEYSDTEVTVYLGLMNDAKKAEEENERNKKDYELAKKYLSENEMKVIDKALDMALEDDLQIVLANAIKNVFSMCRYVDLIQTTDGYGEAMEMLGFKVQELFSLLQSIKRSESNHAFYYLTDTNYYPVVLNQLDYFDISYFDEIFNTLNDIATHKLVGVEIAKEEDASIYKVETEHTSICYGLINGLKVLMSIRSKYINQDDNFSFFRLRDINALKENEEFQLLNSSYEQMLINKLDISRIEKAKSFGKER